MCEHTFVRWDNLTIEAQEGTALPGYREPAIVRHFDAPEALDTRFYEVRAKSALNRVPERSRMPFRWTINPYRGCSHACTYCLGPNTPILMADGRTRLLARLYPGDRIVGTEVRGRYRRYVTTEVLAHWSTIKPAYRVALEDGTELIASGDHRFLTNRGWKFVTGSEQGADRRPHLTVQNELLGTGRFAASPDESSDYKRGYLCGIVRGDGHIGSSTYVRADGTEGRAHRFGGVAARRPLPPRRRGLHRGIDLLGRRRGTQSHAGRLRPPRATDCETPRAHPMASFTKRRLAEGLPGRNLRRRRHVPRIGPSDREQRQADR